MTLLTAAVSVFSLVTLLPAGAAANETGIASQFCELAKTASGQIVSCNALVAAHRTLPFGTKVRVTSLSNRKSVIVTIVDRGPFTKGRIIDLSAGAANAIGMSGLMPVELATVN